MKAEAAVTSSSPWAELDSVALDEEPCLQVRKRMEELLELFDMLPVLHLHRRRGTIDAIMRRGDLSEEQVAKFSPCLQDAEERPRIITWLCSHLRNRTAVMMR